MERYDLMGTPYASGDRAGILRTANATDEKNSDCTDAAITPSNLHNVLGYRKANTAYAGNEIVACPYHAGLMLKCTQAGTTSAVSLNTTGVTVGQVITDGGVKWEVIVLPIELGGHGGTTVNEARKNLGLNVTAIPANSDLDDYKTAGKYSCWLAANAQTLSNNPMADLSTGIILEVIENGDNILQIIYGTLVRGMYVRRCTNSSWNEWRNINNGIKSGYLATSGYVVFENALVFAWKRATISTSGTVVTKPTSFNTYVAVAGQIQTQGEGDNVASWAADRTTTTTDTFTGSKSEDNMVIFWVGYKV